MIYPEDIESKIGFAGLRELIIDKCECRIAREEAISMSFSSDFNEVSRKLESVDEMKTIIESGAPLPLKTIHDVNPWLSQIRSEGSYISADRLRKLCSMLETLGEVTEFFSEKNEESSYKWPRLASQFSLLTTFPDLVKLIESKITKFGSIRDDASQRLYEIRLSLRSAQGSVQSAMRRIIERAVKSGIIDADVTPAVRDGRMVIPVASGNKRLLNGIIHDESASGKTVFIEPSEVVEAGNRLRQLEIEENREEIAVLKDVAAIIRPDIEGIISAIHALGMLDFIRAKALFAVETDGCLPQLTDKPEIDWYHALHPALLLSLRKNGKTPVAMNLRLGDKYKFLIISGPNAGGKSVALKTVAVTQYMAQCGLLPSLYSNSRLGIFKNIFIDIGDRQSIENELSTYSAHLSSMKYFLNYSDKRTIVLADEIGSGTEPQIGGALAQALLQELGKSGCVGVVTTHYQNIKQFAETTPGFVNGAMVYDRQQLQPTFQLSVGNAGSSFALDIAKKTGLPVSVLKLAEQLVGSDYVDNDKYLLDIARDRKYWSNKRLSIREKEKKLEDIVEKYEDSAMSLKSQRNAILREARQQAQEILAGANARIEKAIHEIRIAEAERTRTLEIRKELDSYKKNLASEDSSLALNEPKILKTIGKPKKKHHESKTEKEKLQPIKVGDYVKMSNGGVVGKILSIKDNKCEVAFGSLRTFVERSKLSIASKPKETASSQSMVLSKTTHEESRQRQLNFKNEIDVRGMRADEAIQAVTYFLDDAIQFNSKRVRILHGTGHGILKTLIRQQLQVNSNVASFRDEDVRFGGAGITIVELD